MVRFHILDVHSQDFKNEYEDEFEKKGKYESVDNDNDDADSVGFVLKKSKNSGNNDYNSKYEMVIHLFGMTDDGRSIRVSVNGFEPYFYVEIPNDKAYDVFKDILKMKLEQKKNLNLYNRTKFELVKKEKLFGYTNRRNFPFIKLSVSSIRDFRTLKYLFLSDKNTPIFDFNGDKCKVYEANLDPMLRFFHTTNINPCGWAEVDTEYEETIDIDYTMIKPVKNPSVTVAPFRCGFWDIECYSASGDFPLPKKTFEKSSEQLFKESSSYEEFIDLFFQALNLPESPPPNVDGIFLKIKPPSLDKFKTVLKPIETKLIELFENKDKHTSSDLFRYIKQVSKHLPISGDPVVQIGIVMTNGPVISEKHIFVFGTCSSVDGVVVHSFKTEKEMIEGFMNFCCAQNPDILSGYNVFGFDKKYLYNRMEELNITSNEDFQNLSRVIDIMDPSDTRDAVELQEKFLSSSALGDNTLYLWTTTGRLHIDLYYYIKRIENLPSYKLDDVTRYYMSGKLKSINISDSDRWYVNTSSTKDAEVGKYLVLLDEIGDTIIEKRKIIDIIPSKSLVIEPPTDKIFSLGDLETVVKWAIVKDDVSPAELFKLHRGDANDRATIAKYCIQDCVLVQQLYNKLDVFNNAMAMANTCSVPINYIFTRGQGIKCESLIFKECAIRNQLIEVLPTPIQKDSPLYKEESYEGAIVLVPEPNFYSESPIGVADFASLYPSTIISENISYDTLLWSKDFDMNYKFICYSFGSLDDEKYLTPDVRFTDIEFDIWAPDPEDKRKNPEKIKIGIRICRYLQQPDDKKGSLPDILSMLLAARKSKRKEAEKESDPFRKALLDAEQLAYKLTANSLYGQLGSATFKIRLQHLAASTTAYGRKQILFAKDAIETFYGADVKFKTHDSRCKAEIVYGDSVASYTPVMIRRNGIIQIVNIEELGDEWVSDGDKEYCKLNNIESWTDKGWTNIETIMRHKLVPEKKMIRILTHTGIVDVTDDHSLIRLNGEEVSPKDLKVGDELLHNSFPKLEEKDKPTELELIKAQIDGFFVGDGSCGYYDCPPGLKASWALNNSNMELLTNYKTMCEKVYQELNWVIMPTLESSGVYKLSPRLGENKRGTILDFIKKYRELYYVKNRKHIPNWILNADIDIQKAFWKGFYDADGDKDTKGFIRADQKNQTTMAQLAYLASNIGYNISFNTRIDKPNVFRLTCTTKTQRKNPNAIKKLYEIPYEGYVYDLTTSNHHFQAGVGKMIVHNTDSLFINFNVKDPVTGEKLSGRRAIEETMKLTEEAGKFVTRCLKKPHDFEYDKVFYPFIIFSKKRYVGNKFEESPDNYKQTSMGIATKRRDYAAIVKNVYGGAINTLLNEKDPVKAFHFVQKTCNELVDGKLSSHQITLSKSLRSEYKATTPPPHKILAERIKARDPGNAPASGDRLEFMYIIPDNPQTKLQGDRVETPSFIKENKLKIDYKYYIEHQIYNPITQLFGLFVEQLPGFVKSSKQLTPDEKEAVAGELLFNDIYKRCDKENNRLQTKKFADRFGFTMKETPQVVEKSKTVKNIVSTIQMKQSTLNFSKLDSYLNSVDKKKKK